MRGRVSSAVRCLLQGAIYLYLLAPILIVIPISFSSVSYFVFPPPGFSLKWYANFLSLPELTEALGLSARLALMVMLASTLVGTMAAFGITRYRFAGRELLRTLFLSPMVIPGVVLGIAFLMYFNRVGLMHSFWGLFFAHLVVTLPYVIRTVSATLQGFPRALEEAAGSLGAAPLVTFWTVTLPIVRPGVMAGAIFAFIISFDELVIAMFLAGTHLSTLPVQIYNYIEFTSDPTIAAISVVLILLTTTAVTLLERFVGFSRF